jgi:hypothetical protein
VKRMGMGTTKVSMQVRLLCRLQLAGIHMPSVAGWGMGH